VRYTSSDICGSKCKFMCVFGLTFLSEGWSEGQRGEKLVVVVVRLIRGTKGGARVVKVVWNGTYAPQLGLSRWKEGCAVFACESRPRLVSSGRAAHSFM